MCVVLEDYVVELRNFDPERVRHTSPGQRPGIKTQKKDSPVRAKHTFGNVGYICCTPLGCVLMVDIYPGRCPGQVYQPPAGSLL